MAPYEVYCPYCGEKNRCEGSQSVFYRAEEQGRLDDEREYENCESCDRQFEWVYIPSEKRVTAEKAPDIGNVKSRR